MAKYLDQLGLLTLWKKIKNTFVASNNPGPGLSIEKDANGFNLISLKEAAIDEIGGITLSQLNAASSNILPFSGIETYLGTPQQQSIAESDPNNIKYDPTKKVFYYEKKTSGQTTKYYSNWNTGDYYGTETGQGRTPEAGKIYTYDGNLYIWDGTDLVKVSGDDAFGIIKVGNSTLTADKSKDTLNVIAGNGITIVADESSDNDNLSITLKPASGSEIGGIKVASSSGNSSTDTGKKYKVIDGGDKFAAVEIPKVTESEHGLMTSNLYNKYESVSNDVTVLKSTVASTFQYAVRQSLPSTIGTTDGLRPEDRSSNPSSDSNARMYVIYLVPISSVYSHDEESSTDSDDNGAYQTYAEYVLIDGGDKTKTGFERYSWERLGTTDVNIDSITEPMINQICV